MSDETNRSNPPGWPSMGMEYLKNNYTKIADQCNLKEGHDGDLGIWLNKNSLSFNRKRFNLNGKTAENWSTHWQNEGMDKSPLVVFEHSTYDAGSTSDEVYTVSLKLNQVRESYAEDDQGLNKEREWYLDHISAHLKDGTVSEVFGPTQHPERDKPAKVDNFRPDDDPSSNRGAFDVLHSYGKLSCKINQAVVIGTRGYEKDSAPPDSTGYYASWKEYVDLYKDLVKAMSTGKWKNFLFDCIGIGIRKMVNNPDDQMIPCITVFTHGACRWIREQLGGEISFSKYIVGDESSPFTIEDGNKGDYVQVVNDCLEWDPHLVDSVLSRHYKLNYQASIFLSDKIEPGVKYRIVNEDKTHAAYLAWYASVDFKAIVDGAYYNEQYFEPVDLVKNLYKIVYDDSKGTKKYLLYKGGAVEDFPFEFGDVGDVFELRRVDKDIYKILLNGIHPLTYSVDTRFPYETNPDAGYYALVKGAEGAGGNRYLWKLNIPI